MAAWSIPTGISWGSLPEGANGTDMVAKVGVSEGYCQRRTPLSQSDRDITDLECKDASVAVTKLILWEGDGRVEMVRVGEERGQEKEEAAML